MSGLARIPGALESTCGSPCGNTIRSPSLQPDRRLAHGISPARATGDQVIFDDPLGARHHDRRDLARRRSLRHPRRAQLEVEVHRAGQADGTQDVGQDISRRASCRAGRAVIRFGRRSRSFVHLEGLPGESDARAWLQHHTSHTVDLPRNLARRVSKGKVYDDLLRHEWPRPAERRR